LEGYGYDKEINGIQIIPIIFRGKIMFIFLMVLLFMIVIWFSKIRIGLYVKKDGVNDRIKIEIGLLYGLIPLRREIPFIRVEPAGIQVKQTLESGNTTLNQQNSRITSRKIKKLQYDAKQLIERVVNFHQIIKRFLAKVKIRKLVWKSRIGTGDAAETGVLAGLIWGIKSGLIVVVRRFMDVEEPPKITVTPAFMQACFYSEFECSIHFRCGHAIVAGFSLLFNWIRGRRKRHKKELKRTSALDVE
jgi:hypothetical protein